MSETSRDDGFDDFLDAIEADEAYYLACENGHGSLPPRRACPHCGSMALSEEPLPAAGTVETYTTTHVSIPSFAAQTPYVTAIVDFGPVRVTGIVSDDHDVSVGTTVGLGVRPNATTGERTVAFHPR